MSLGSDLAAAVASIVPDAAILRSIVQGPAAGPGSLVTLPNGFQVKTLARVSSEAAGPFVQKSGDTMSGSLNIAVADDAFAMFVRGVSTALRFIPRPTYFELAAADPTNTVGKKLILNGSPLEIQSDGVSIVRARNDAIVVGGFSVATAGTSSPLQVDGDVSLRLAAGTISINSFYNGAWRHHANGYAAALRADPTGVLQILGSPQNTAGANAPFTPNYLWTIGLTSGHFLPGSDGSQNFGGPANRGGTAYFATGTINTSDARLKRWGSLLSAQPGLVKVGLLIPSIVGTFQLLQSIQEKGQRAFDALSPEDQANTSPEQLGQDLARWHIGLRVQELEALFDTVRVEYPDLPTPAQLGLYGRDPIKTRVARIIIERQPVMVDEPYSDVEYIDQGTHFVAQAVTRTRPVPAPLVMKAVRNPDGTPRMVQVGERDTGIVDGSGRRVMEPIMTPEFRPVPATAAVETTVYDEVDQGEYILSTRPDQIAYLCIGAAHIARQELEARVAALEAAAA